MDGVSATPGTRSAQVVAYGLRCLAAAAIWMLVLGALAGEAHACNIEDDPTACTAPPQHPSPTVSPAPAVSATQPTQSTVTEIPLSEAENYPDPNQDLNDVLDRVAAEQVIDPAIEALRSTEQGLSARDLQILEQWVSGEKTASQIAKEMGLTPTRVVEIAQLALRRLRVIIPRRVLTPQESEQDLFSLSPAQEKLAESFPLGEGDTGAQTPIADIFPGTPADAKTLTLPAFPLPAEQQIAVSPFPLPQEQTPEQVSPPPYDPVNDLRGRPIFLPILPAYGLQELFRSLLGTPLQQMPLSQPQVVCC